MSRRDRSGGSGLSRGVPRQGPRGRDRAGGTAGAPEERAGLIDRPGVFDDDTTVTTRARDLDRLVAELRDLEAYNQRQERTLRRAQRDAERERRSQLDGTAVALERSSDGFFGSTRRSFGRSPPGARPRVHRRFVARQFAPARQGLAPRAATRRTRLDAPAPEAGVHRLRPVRRSRRSHPDSHRRRLRSGVPRRGRRDPRRLPPRARDRRRASFGSVLDVPDVRDAATSEAARARRVGG